MALGCVCALVGPCAMTASAVSPPRQVVLKQPPCLPPMDVSLSRRKLINYQIPTAEQGDFVEDGICLLVGRGSSLGTKRQRHLRTAGGQTLT